MLVCLAVLQQQTLEEKEQCQQEEKRGRAHARE